MGRPDLPGEARFADNDSRLANAVALEAEIAAWTRTMDAAVLCERLAAAQIPAGKVSTVEEMLENPQLRHRGQIVEVDHPGARPVPMQGFVAKLSSTPQAIRRGLPATGEHTADVLADWLACDAGALERYAARGAFAETGGAA